jgi:cell division protein FtsW
MTAQSAATPSVGMRRRRRSERLDPAIDYGVLVVVLFLLGFGFLMVTSASMPIADRNYDDPFFFVWRHGFALVLSLALGGLCFVLPVSFWERGGPWLVLVAIALLVLLLIPGVGRTVNGATRWIPLGVLNLQPSEIMKLVAVVYTSGYLVRREIEVHTSFSGFLRPMILIGLGCALIMAQPDFGTTAVILATVMGLLFLGGVNILAFAFLFLLVALALVFLIIVEPYRLQRVTSFLDPFADPFNTGYQLSQALIAFGRGEWFGVGLGNGIQKQFYLPEAHTDFLLAVVGEEFGLVGVLVLVGMFAYLTWRAFAIGARARAQQEPFSCFAAHGIGLLIGLQAFVNLGVNMGMLPTKGLPLPFLSYGSNALIVATMCAALLLRIDLELRRTAVEPIPEGGLRPNRGGRWQRA